MVVLPGAVATSEFERAQRVENFIVPWWAADPQYRGVSAPEKRKLSPRLEQVLSGLLHGDGEKQIAYSLSLSIHTVHCHVKKIYQTFDVHARSELMALFLERTAAERDALLRISAAICSPAPAARESSRPPPVRDIGSGHRGRYRLASRRMRRG